LMDSVTTTTLPLWASMEIVTHRETKGSREGWVAGKQPHQSEFNLDSLLCTSHACFLTVGPQGLMCDVSLRLSSLLEFQPEELCNTKFLDLITEDMYDEVDDMMEKVRTTGGWMRMQIPVYTKEASKFNTVLNMVTTTEDNMVHVIFQPQSTSPEELAENSLCMQSGTPTVEINANGKITAWNAQMMELCGFSKEEMVGLSFLDLFTVGTVQKVRRMLRLSREISGASTCKITLYTLQGIPKIIRLHAMACHDKAGQLISITVAAQQVEKYAAKAGEQSMSDLPTADGFDNIVSDASDDSCGEWEDSDTAS